MMTTPPSHDPVSASAPRVYVIGDQLFDAVRNQLVRGDEVVKLEPRVSQLLECLASEGGQVLSKEELLRRVWGLNVVDQALHRAVSLARTALEDRRGSTPLLETVANRGYRLNDVVILGTPPSDRSDRRRSLELAGALGVGVGMACAAFLLWGAVNSQTASYAPPAPAADGPSTTYAPPAPP